MLRLKSANIAVCFLPLALVACGDNPGNDDPRTRPPLVRSTPVERAVDTSRAFTGVVVARTQSDLGFRVPGKILERLVDTGQSVKRGQPLMRLDPVDLTLQAQAQQRAVDAARARARKASNDETRYRGLVATGAVSASEYDQISAAADTAKAELSAAQAQANVALNATSYALLLADADGLWRRSPNPDRWLVPGRWSSGWPDRDSAKRWCSCPRRCDLPLGAKPKRRAMATTISPSPQRYVCFLIQQMLRPAHLRQGTCLRVSWRTRR